VSASIPESTKKYVGSVFNREHVRGPSLFFGIGEERPFYVEKVPTLLAERLRHNVSFFYLNYFLLVVVFFLLTTVLSPSALVGMALLAAVWMWFIRATQNGSLQVGSVSIPQKTASAALAGISVFSLLYLFSSIFWYSIFSSGIFILVHAFLRDASMHKDLDDHVAMEGDFDMDQDGMGGGADQFLNPGSHAV